MKTVKTFANNCPVCDGLLDAATCLSHEDREEPKEGDITICGHCAALLIFTKDLHLESIDPAQLTGIFSEFPQFKVAIEFIKQYLKNKTN
jgi:hypothetical protein